MAGLDMECLAVAAETRSGSSRGLRLLLLLLALLAGVFATFGVFFAPQANAAGGSRHFEKVSPADKGYGDIVGDGATTVASRFGDAVAFNSRTPFGDTLGSGAIGQTQYVARRTDEGWTTHAITPTPRPDALQVAVAGTRLHLYSDDLRTAVIRAYDLPGAVDDAPLRNSIYVENTATGRLETVTVSQVDLPSIVDFSGYPTFGFWGISGDARHIAFVTETQFLPNAAVGAPNVYQWDDGVLRVAGILPDGTVPASGSTMVASYRAAVSVDGSRLLFNASSGGNPQLYMRIGGTRTVWISETELDPGDVNYQADPNGVQLQAVTPDGRIVFFTTETRLLRDDDNEGIDLYRWVETDDPARESNLTLISHDGALGGAEVVGMSDDGERVYYQTQADHLVVWDHGTTRLINSSVPQSLQSSEKLGVRGYAPGAARVTSDGSYVAFIVGSGSDQDLLGNQTNGHREMYLYSLRDDALSCVSCPAGPATSDATVLPAATEGSVTITNAGFRPRFLDDTGRVFFSTAEELVVQDRNGVLDTYEYDPASDTLKLLSTGKGSDPATFADASASGDDVFIVTRQRLIASDRDELVDVYDARDGSSLVEPSDSAKPACEGDACQALPAATPAEVPLATLFSDDGGVVPLRSKLLSVRHRLTLVGATGTVQIKLFARGKLRWSGRGLRAGSIRRGRSGAYELRLRLRRAARMRLRTSGSYTTSVHLRFVSAGGDEVKRTISATFEAAARKGR